MNNDDSTMTDSPISILSPDIHLPEQSQPRERTEHVSAPTEQGPHPAPQVLHPIHFALHPTPSNGSATHKGRNRRAESHDTTTSSKDNAATWTTDKVEILKSWLLVAIGWVFIHGKCQRYYSRCYSMLNFISVICALVSVAGVCFNDLYKDRWPLYLFAAIGGLSAAGPFYINSQFNLKKNASKHKNAKRDWMTIERNIQTILKKKLVNRGDADTFISIIEKEFVKVHKKAPLAKARYIKEWVLESHRREAAWMDPSISEIDLEAAMPRERLPALMGMPMYYSARGAAPQYNDKINNQKLSSNNNIINHNNITLVDSVDPMGANASGHIGGDISPAPARQAAGPNRQRAESAPTDTKRDDVRADFRDGHSSHSEPQRDSPHSHHEGFVSEPDFNNIDHEHVRTLISDRVSRADKFDIALNYYQMENAKKNRTESHMYSVHYRPTMEAN